MCCIQLAPSPKPKELFPGLRTNLNQTASCSELSIRKDNLAQCPNIIPLMLSRADVWKQLISLVPSFDASFTAFDSSTLPFSFQNCSPCLFYDSFITFSPELSSFSPLQFCVFSSRLMGRGHYVFDRRWDRMRLALQNMVEKHLNAQMWRRVYSLIILLP